VSASPDTLVDGDRDATRPFVSYGQAGGTIELDLRDSFVIRSIRLVNRRDGQLDGALPITVEVSQTGAVWHSVGVCKDHFREWSVPVAELRARFVRLHSPYALGLNEVEVYGRPN
jgi:hypothetical protein